MTLRHRQVGLQRPPAAAQSLAEVARREVLAPPYHPPLEEVHPQEAARRLAAVLVTHSAVLNDVAHQLAHRLHLRVVARALFVAQHLQDWLRKVGVRPIQIYPGSPWENGYNERFNGILRQELLNTEWFHSVKQAQVAINIWLKEYNHIRPHHALGMRPPVPETLLEKREIYGTEIVG
jgi:putative transposase